MSTDQTLADRLEELSKKATPGPWVLCNGSDIFNDEVSGRHIADCDPDSGPAERWSEDKANAAFIVELVNNLPVIISALRGRESADEGMVTAKGGSHESR